MMDEISITVNEMTNQNPKSDATAPRFTNGVPALGSIGAARIVQKNGRPFAEHAPQPLGSYEKRPVRRSKAVPNSAANATMTACFASLRSSLLS
jgi:hypothetical protein